MNDTTQQDSVAVLREALKRLLEAYDDSASEFEAAAAAQQARDALQSQQGASADRGEAWMNFDEVRFYMAEHGCCVPFGTRLKSDGRVWNGKEWMRYTEAEPTPPSPAESAEGSLTYAQQRKVVEHMTTELRAAIPMLQSVLQRAEAIDCQPLAAAPSGVSDADVQRIIDRVGRENSIDGMDGDSRDRLLVRAALKAAFAAIGRSGEGHSAEWCAGWNAHLLATAAQPQPGRVEGMVLVPVELTEEMHKALVGSREANQRSWKRLLAAAPTASSQEPDHG